MAGEIIRPKDLTPRSAPVASELMVVDNSVTVGAATIKAIVEAGRPAASHAEAIAGTDAAKAMTPLTTKQSIAAEIGVSIASKALGDLASTAVQPTSLATVATSGEYEDLSGKPIIPPGLADGDKGDISVSGNGTVWEINKRFDTVATLLADTTVAYAGSGAAVTVGAGDIVEAQGFRYEVAASGAVDHHVTTAGGVRLYALPDTEGRVTIVQCGARDVRLAPGFDSSAAIKAAFRASMRDDVSTIFIDAGHFEWSETIDGYEYFEVQYNEYYGVPSYKNPDIIGAGRFKTRLTWTGGASADGKRGTGILLRSKTLRQGVPEIGDYFGRVSGIEFTTNVPRQHNGGWPLSAGFVTASSEFAGIQCRAEGEVDHANYPILIDKTGANDNLASCALYYNGLNAIIEGNSISGFAFGIWAGQGYGSEIRNNFLEFNLCPITCRDAVTTTSITNNVIHRNAAGIMFNVCDKIRVEGNVLQGNYAGADYIFASWNANIDIVANYSEVSLYNVFIGSDSGTQYRNKNIRFERNVGLRIHANMFAFETITLVENHIESVNFFGATVDNCSVIARDNYKRLPLEVEYDYVPFTEWTGLPNRYLYDESVLPNPKLTNAIKEFGHSGRVVGPIRHSKVLTDRLNVFEVQVPNTQAAGVLRVSLTKISSANPRATLVGEYVIAWGRIPDGYATASVTMVSEDVVNDLGSGSLPGTSLLQVSGMSGAPTGVNTFTVSDGLAEGGAEAFSLYEASVSVSLGNFALKKV